MCFNGDTLSVDLDMTTTPFDVGLNITKITAWYRWESWVLAMCKFSFLRMWQCHGYLYLWWTENKWETKVKRMKRVHNTIGNDVKIASHQVPKRTSLHTVFSLYNSDTVVRKPLWYTCEILINSDSVAQVMIDWYLMQWVMIKDILFALFRISM